MLLRWWFFPFFLIMSMAVAAALLLGYATVVAYPSLPSLEVLTDYRPKIPLQVFSHEGELIGEFGEERRALVSIADVPKTMVQAIIAAEDERFYEHGGVDYIGVARAALSNFMHGGARQGASTITMQVARNFFLTKEKTFTRKFNEALLAFKIEHNLSKDQILQLYINQIFLGQRAYGFAAAAQTYFGKPLARLNVSEQAMLAGLPKAPSTFNPVANPSRAKTRQEYVLKRMLALGYIDEETHRTAVDAPVEVRREGQSYATRADYLTEMVRQTVYDQFKEDAYTSGLRVHTTISRQHQDAAYAAVRRGVLDYDRRHGYRGAEGYMEIPSGATDESIEELFGDESSSDGIYPALVLQLNREGMVLFAKGIGRVSVAGEGLRFAQRMLGDKAPAERRLRRGALVRVTKDDDGRWQVVQLPLVEAALVAVDSNSGAIRALVGGFDFGRNQFNHVTQAYRQPGSSFKPFVYSAALEKGFTPATIINDAPLSFDATETGSAVWEPKNFDGEFDGPITMRTALTKSKNMVSIRILQAIGPQYAQDYAARFGFERKLIPPYLTMALGAGSVTPLQMAAGYATFANGGFLVSPYYIDRVTDGKGKVIQKSRPARAGDAAPRIIDARNAFLMTSMMQDVVRGGTAARAMKLGRTDLAGKTGTTNDQRDAWFAGFNPKLVAIAWVGYDNPKSLGSSETGAAAALPIWMSYMETALKGLPDEPAVAPEGVVAAQVNPHTGLRDDRGTDSVPEYFFQENLPPDDDAATQPSEKRRGKHDEVDDQLY
ncbi:MAG: penicillin-binding protein 1A [Betaproteobacteria bacterium]|nr:penicillin-binding protein 1A [Betaproteobacteria bacterium]